MTAVPPDVEGSIADRMSDEKCEDGRYRAPALEKGLDILELLAAERGPVTRKEIFNRLGRSRGELSRMVHALEFRGYIERDAVSDGYRLSDRSLLMDRPQPCTRTLIETALPVMRQLALSLGQSCHLVLRPGSAALERDSRRSPAVHYPRIAPRIRRYLSRRGPSPIMTGMCPVYAVHR